MKFNLPGKVNDKKRNSMMVAKNFNAILKKLLLDKTSDLYLNKNTNTIKRYLNERAIDIPLTVIKQFLATQKSAHIATSNISARKISESSKSFFGKAKFFYTNHTDILFLSKKRNYNSRDLLLITLIEQISGYTYIELIKSTKSVDVISAFLRIFARSPYLPCKGVWIMDNGIEYRSREFANFAKMHEIKLNFTPIRLHRGSRGSGLAERVNRKIRRLLESILAESQEKQPMKTIIKLVETKLNAEPQPILNGLSAKIALEHEPKYIMLLKASNNFRRKKYLREAIEKKIDIFSIVRIKNNTKKQIYSKESYGIYSTGLFIVLQMKESNLIPYYVLGSLFSLVPIGKYTYSANELFILNISYARACYIECLNNVKKVIRVLDNNNVEFVTYNDPMIHVGPKQLLSAH